MVQCGRCGETVPDCNAIVCSGCKKHFDYACSGITESGYRRLGAERQAAWRCPGCKSPKPITMDQVMQELSSIKLTLAPMMELINDIKEIKSEISDIKSTMGSYSEKLESVDQRLIAVEKAQYDIVQLKEQVSKLEEDLNEKNQWTRLNNVEIKGIPMKDHENLFNVVAKIGSKIMYPIEKRDINFLARVPSRDQKTKPIIVSFVNRYTKENFVAAARSYKTLCSADIDLGDKGRIYINDHLTVQNKILLTKAKHLAKEKNVEYVWVKNCKIFARKNVQSKVIAIRKQEDLNKII